MAPPPITEDYYMILEVQQNATSDQITKAYRRLALKLHPDRSAEGGSTQAFQLLGQAYATLNDEVKRRAYDLIYPSIQRSKTEHPNTQTQTSRPHPASAPRSETLDDIAQIAALKKAKEERIAKWIVTRSALESPILETQRSIQRLKHEVKRLFDIEANEIDEESRRRHWVSRSWTLHPHHEAVSKNEKASRDRARQERKIEKDLKERRLDTLQADLLTREAQIEEAKKSIDAQNRRDDQAMVSILMRSRVRDPPERRNKRQQEHEGPAKSPGEQDEQSKKRRDTFETLLTEQQERLTKLRREQEEQAERSKKKQEAFETHMREQQTKLAELEREQEELRERARAEATAREAAARQETARRETAQRHWTDDIYPDLNNNSARRNQQSPCEYHDTWWHKVNQRAVCPECLEEWNFLLQCPGCQTKACPRCRSDMRQRLQRH